MDLSAPSTPSFRPERYRRIRDPERKLTLNLKYHIEKKNLKSENKDLPGQFTFAMRWTAPTPRSSRGGRGSAPEGRSGEITSNLPFSDRSTTRNSGIWALSGRSSKIWLVKVRPRRSRLLGAIFGGGEELSYLSSTLAPRLYPHRTPRSSGTCEMLAELSGSEARMKEHVIR